MGIRPGTLAPCGSSSKTAPELPPVDKGTEALEQMLLMPAAHLPPPGFSAAVGQSHLSVYQCLSAFLPQSFLQRCGTMPQLTTSAASSQV